MEQVLEEIKRVHTTHDPRLDLSERAIGDEGCETIVEPLSKLTHLVTLNLNNTGIGDAGADVIADALSGMKNLQQFRCARNSFGDYGMEAIHNELIEMPKLTTIRLGRNKIKEMPSFAEMTSLQSLHLEYNDIKEPSSLAGLTRLVDCNIRGNYISGEIVLPPFLKLLNLRNNELKNQGIHATAHHIAKMQYLTVLDLSKNKFTDIRALSRAISNLKRLHELQLSRNAIGSDGAKELGQALLATPQLEVLELIYVDIGDVGLKHLIPAFEKMTYLRELDLSINQITDTAMGPLCKALAKMTLMEKLGLYQNSFKVEGMEHLVTALKKMPKLTSLDISRNEFGDEGIQSLFPVLGRLPQLMELEIGGAGIGSDGATMIAQNMSKMATLELLVLSENKINDIYASVIAESLRHRDPNKPEITVDLTDNPIASKPKSLRNLPKNVFIDIDNSPTMARSGSAPAAPNPPIIKRTSGIWLVMVVLSLITLLYLYPSGTLSLLGIDSFMPKPIIATAMVIGAWVLPILVSIYMAILPPKSSGLRDDNWFDSRNALGHYRLHQFSYGNFVVLLCILVEFVQMCAFAFPSSIEWPEIAKTIASISLLDLPPFAVTFSIASAGSILTVVWIEVCVYSKSLRTAPLTNTVMLVASIFLIPATSKLLQAVSCTYINPDAPTLDVMPTMLCWSVDHMPYAIIGLLVYGAFIPMVTLGLARWQERDEKTNARFEPRFVMRLTVIKILMSGVHAFLADVPEWRFSYAGIQSGLMLILTIISVYQQPCSVALVGHMRQITLVMAAASQFVSIYAAIVQNASDPLVMIILGGVVGGVVVLGVIISLLMPKKKKALLPVVGLIQVKPKRERRKEEEK